uniref:PREDICTED: GapPol polyproteinlike putative n=1 Tax=Albugo laibachii Nc14 TaxID=890382 RepID=F0W325_9STRA|nr:PREDICTED: GapPol polyproteinlike putative [Albugo laibachii Nc14]|eukprot:CCA15462.1 PREDICTED: GapPol polyproteinlike putative [Albugo laibachii Nc14]
MDKHLADLMEQNLMYRNPDSRWGSAPRIVAKKEVGSYRMTVDLRAITAVTVPMARPMPHLEVVLEGSRYYFSLDCFRFYWHLPLHPNSQDYFTVVTPNGLFTANRVIMGSSDDVAYAQQVTEEVMKPVLGKGVQVWLDDAFGYADSEMKLLDTLEVVMKRCQDFGVKLHPAKCTFLSYSTVWCGKKFSSEVISHCASRIQGFCELEPPETAAELQHFLCAVNWMRNNILNYKTLVKDLQDVLEYATKSAGNRKKRNLMNVLLRDHGWSPKHDALLQQIKGILFAMVPMAHPKDTWDVCLYTDASQDHWGAIIAQVAPGILSNPRVAGSLSASFYKRLVQRIYA